MSRAVQKITLLANAGAGNGNAVTLVGGKYALNISGTLGTTNQLQTLAPDGSTWVPVGSSILAVGQSLYSLPAGQYRMSIAGGTPSNIYADLIEIPRY